MGFPIIWLAGLVSRNSKSVFDFVILNNARPELSHSSQLLPILFAKDDTHAIRYAISFCLIGRISEGSLLFFPPYNRIAKDISFDDADKTFFQGVFTVFEYSVQPYLPMRMCLEFKI
jgi:hypothetical protein